MFTNMEDGNYAVYKNKLYKASIRENGELALYSKTKDFPGFTESVFEGVYQLIVKESEVSEAYELTTYGVIDGEKFDIVGKGDNGTILCTYDHKKAEKFSFMRVERCEYCKEVANCEFVQERESILD